MKFLCLTCDTVMAFAERQIPGDGTMAAVFACPDCGREMAMLTNPMETQLVSSMGVKVGGREVPAQPMEGVRSSLAGGREDAFVEPKPPQTSAAHLASPDSSSSAREDEASPGREHTPRPGPVEWSPEAVERLGRVPRFVRGMVKRIYSEYARENAIRTITPDVMDTARTDLGLEGM
jgi:predicted RNA-binding Zn-ribbon protein involved in translation (DUF1610 family)